MEKLRKMMRTTQHIAAQPKMEICFHCATQLFFLPIFSSSGKAKKKHLFAHQFGHLYGCCVKMYLSGHKTLAHTIILWPTTVPHNHNIYRTHPTMAKLYGGAMMLLLLNTVRAQWDGGMGGGGGGMGGMGGGILYIE